MTRVFAWSCRVLACLLVVFALSWSLTGSVSISAQGEGHTLEFLDSETLSIEFESEETGLVTQTVVVANNGPALAQTTFRLKLVDGDGVPYDGDAGVTVALGGGNPCPVEAGTCIEANGIEANDVEQYSLTFTIGVDDEEQSSSFTGYLVVAGVVADEGTTIGPGVRPMTVGPTTEDEDEILPPHVIWGPAAFALIVVFLGYLFFVGIPTTVKLRNPIKAVGWSGDSWVSTLTSASSALGVTAVLGLSAIEGVSSLPHNTFAALVLVFGLSPLLAPMVFDFLSIVWELGAGFNDDPRTIGDLRDRVEKTSLNAPDEGNVFGFLCAAGFTLFAAYGDIFAVGYLLTALKPEDTVLSQYLINLLHIVLLIVGILATFYALIKIYWAPRLKVRETLRLEREGTVQKAVDMANNQLENAVAAWSDKKTEDLLQDVIAASYVAGATQERDAQARPKVSLL